MSEYICKNYHNEQDYLKEVGNLKHNSLHYNNRFPFT